MDDFDYDMYEEEEMYHDSSHSASANLWIGDEEEDEPLVSASELWNLCLQPTVSDGLTHTANLLLMCLIFRLTTQIVSLPRVVQHAVSSGTGLLVLHHFFRWMTFYVVLFGLALYLLLFLLSRCMKKYQGVITSVICITILVVCELFVVKKSEWHKIRGAQMLVAMKVISIAFDLEIGVLQSLPSPVEFAGYILCVGTSVFGPWVPYRDYIAIYKKPLWNGLWLWQGLKSVVVSLMFLTISTCWIHWLIPDDSWRWWLAYRDALSFRSSHYFVSFLSEASSIMAGFGEQEDSNWSLPVSRPHFVEIPRSLVQVVVSWNIPMHHFLKHYIFRTTKPLGSFTAILATYGVSSLLHGLNFQLAAVLFSLGVYTYVEYVLRQKLATVFSACILVRPCRRDCLHRNKEKRFAVVIANVGFGVLSFFHLIYLGVMFDTSDSTLQEEGYNYIHTLAKWATLNFASHWVALFTYIFYFLI